MPDNRPANSTAWNWIVIGVVLIGGLLYLSFARKNAAPAAAAAGTAPGTAATGILELGNPEGRAAPAWTLSDVNGRPVSLSQFAGHPVVMDFWATWCGPCQIEAPWWRQLQDQYRSQGLVIIGVSEDASLEDVKKYIIKKPFNYQIVWDNNQLETTYGVPFGLPSTLFIDRQGKIAQRFIGLAGKPELDKAIRGIL